MNAVYENLAHTSSSFKSGTEAITKLRIYVYLDDKFNQKTEVIDRPYQSLLDININF
jgi:hypothetical protein